MEPVEGEGFWRVEEHGLVVSGSVHGCGSGSGGSPSSSGGHQLSERSSWSRGAFDAAAADLVPRRSSSALRALSTKPAPSKCAFLTHFAQDDLIG
jgi:hypothetical protein